MSVYEKLAAAYLRSALPEQSRGRDDFALVELGQSAGLKLHQLKRTRKLPRVRAVLGILHAVNPECLLDIGSGRGVFLWPLLDAFPSLRVTAVERDEDRQRHLEAVRRGGIDRLQVIGMDATRLPFVDGAFEVVTVLEVLEHQNDPTLLAREVLRLASRFVIASVPSKEDNNPEHVSLFTAASLTDLLREAGATKVSIQFVLNHIIAVARVGGR